MNAIWLFYFLPLLAVWIVVGGIAIARRHRHPRVSALVLISIGAMLVASVGTQVSVWLVSRALARSSGLSSMAPYFAVIGLVNMLLRTAAWATLLTAIFGWRPGGSQHPAFQFSIRGLLVLTLAVAVLLGSGRAVVGWLGGISPYWVAILDDLPVAVCWFCGCWVAIRRWNRHPLVSGLTLAATLLSAASFLAFHLVWMSNLTSGDIYLVQWASVLSGLVAPVVWSLLLAAALGWRTDAATMAHGESASATSQEP